MIDIKVIREQAEKLQAVDGFAEPENFDYLHHAYFIETRPEVMLALCDEVERLRKDAARYQWLTDDHTDHETRLIASTIGQYIALRGKGATDAAIDTAMKPKDTND